MTTKPIHPQRCFRLTSISTFFSCRHRGKCFLSLCVSIRVYCGGAHAFVCAYVQRPHNIGCCHFFLKVRSFAALKLTKCTCLTGLGDQGSATLGLQEHVTMLGFFFFLHIGSEDWAQALTLSRLVFPQSLSLPNLLERLFPWWLFHCSYCWECSAFRSTHLFPL